VITGNQLEVLVALVLGLDAVVIAGIVISRLAGRRQRQEPAAQKAGRDDAYGDRAAYDRLVSAIGTVPARRPIGDAPNVVEPGEPLAPPIDPNGASLEEPPPIAEPALTIEPNGAPFEGPPPFEPTEEVESGEPVESGEALESAETLVARPAPAVPPAGLDFGPTWVDPLVMAATAAAEWRHALRRDLARAAHHGRSAMVMHVKLDIEGRPDLSIQEVARLEGLLLDTLVSFVRASDHVDRTGPARFHMILSEMPETGAIALAERLKHVFAEDEPTAPRLLIGWAAMETEADVALAIQRAAERVDDGRDRAAEAGPAD